MPSAPTIVVCLFTRRHVPTGCSARRAVPAQSLDPSRSDIRGRAQARRAQAQTRTHKHTQAHNRTSTHTCKLPVYMQASPRTLWSPPRMQRLGRTPWSRRWCRAAWSRSFATGRRSPSCSRRPEKCPRFSMSSTRTTCARRLKLQRARPVRRAPPSESIRSNRWSIWVKTRRASRRPPLPTRSPCSCTPRAAQVTLRASWSSSATSSLSLPPSRSSSPVCEARLAQTSTWGTFPSRISWRWSPSSTPSASPTPWGTQTQSRSSPAPKGATRQGLSRPSGRRSCAVSLRCGREFAPARSPRSRPRVHSPLS
mmetsp:Transcript_12369/g.24833  ORF Transcript_12369/g.24833 Transcript_12369/m.24833 type:complete len:310 (+) Transcript_12369:694-1623(+)